MQTVLFVCTANQCRSPIAQETFNQFILDSEVSTLYKATSAGTWTKTGLASNARSTRLASKVGVDLRSYKTNSVDDIDLNAYDWVVVMEKSHKEALTLEHPELGTKIHLLTTLAGEVPSDIPEPLQHDDDTAIGVLRDMQNCIKKFAQRLIGGGHQ